jgi:hypothetical protein
MTCISYQHAQGAQWLATAPTHPDLYLTWLDPNADPAARLNVFAHRRESDWAPVPIGHRLGWHAFQVQAETLLAVDEHTSRESQPEARHHMRCNRTTGALYCACGHWRMSAAPYTLAELKARWAAHTH